MKRRLFFVLLVSCVACCLRAAPEPPQLRGVMRSGHTWAASLVEPAQRRQAWCLTGERFNGWTLESISEQGAVVVSPAGERRVLALPDSAVTNTREPPADPAAWRQWVNSSENPMLNAPADPPADFGRWSALSAARRAEIVEWYRLHGWSLGVTLDPRDIPATEFEPLHGDERQAIRARKEHAFFRALAPEQRALHTTALRDRSPESVERFLASLQPAQRAVFNQLDDFTQRPAVPLR